MKYKTIATEYNEALVDKLADMAVKNDPALDSMRCVIKFKNSNLIQFLTIDDFMNCDPAYDDISQFRLCQMVKT